MGSPTSPAHSDVQRRGGHAPEEAGRPERVKRRPHTLRLPSSSESHHRGGGGGGGGGGCESLPGGYPERIPPELVSRTPLAIVKDAKEFLRSQAPVFGAWGSSLARPARAAPGGSEPGAASRRGSGREASGPETTPAAALRARGGAGRAAASGAPPFEEVDAAAAAAAALCGAPPRRLPSLGRGSGGRQAESAPPTRGVLHGNAPLTPVRVPSPPRTDPPRGRQRKKTSLVSPAFAASAAKAPLRQTDSFFPTPGADSASRQDLMAAPPSREELPSAAAAAGSSAAAATRGGGAAADGGGRRRPAEALELRQTRRSRPSSASSPAARRAAAGRGGAPAAAARGTEPDADAAAVAALGLRRSGRRVADAISDASMGELAVADTKVAAEAAASGGDAGGFADRGVTGRPFVSTAPTAHANAESAMARCCNATASETSATVAHAERIGAGRCDVAESVIVHSRAAKSTHPRPAEEAARYSTFVDETSSSPVDECVDLVEQMNGGLEPLELIRARTDCDYWDDAEDGGAPGDAEGLRMVARKPLGEDANTLVRRCSITDESFASSATASAHANLAGFSAGLAADESAESSEMTPAGAMRGATFSWVRGELIGRGSLGTVHKALDQRTGQLMAVKEVALDLRDQSDDKFRRALQNEIDLYKDLQHPHIVSYLGQDSIGGTLYIYLEYMPGGSISQVLSEFGRLDEIAIARYTSDIILGLEYLHTRDPPVLHRDIKGANILVGIDRTVKLSDFGCSKRSQGTAIHTLRGSIPWMAPEVMCQSGYGRKADIWSLGCVLIEMSTAAAPWGTFDNCLAAMVRIAMSDETPPVPAHLSDICQGFVALCTRRNPQERPDAAELLQHAFVAGLALSQNCDESWG